MKPKISVETSLSPKSQVICLSVLLASFILAYFPVWKNLINAWSKSDDYSHGFFIIPLCIYIVWQKRQILSHTSIRPSASGLVLVVFSLLFYLVSYFGEISTTASFSMVLLLAGVTIYFYGFKVLKELLFPLFMLLFMIPIPSQIYSTLTIPFQLLVSIISTDIVSLVGIPIYREGNLLHLPERTLQVVQACSGLRSMISLLTLSAIFGYITMNSNPLRALLFLSAIPVAIVVNIIRVLILIAAEHYFDYELTTGALHTGFGILIFVLALLLIYTTKGVLSIWDSSANQKSS